MRESWWYPLRHTSTRRVSVAWIAWGLPVCCGCLSTSIGSTETRLRARETREENEIPWLPLHVGNPGFLLLVYSHFLTLKMIYISIPLQEKKLLFFLLTFNKKNSFWKLISYNNAIFFQFEDIIILKYKFLNNKVECGGHVDLLGLIIRKK
jgi:hypothetical protein